MIFSILDWFLRQREDEYRKAGSIANQRLQLLLVHDQMRLTPEQKERLRHELLEVLAKYVEVDSSEVDLELQKSPESRNFILVSNVPIRRVLPESEIKENITSDDLELTFEEEQYLLTLKELSASKT